MKKILITGATGFLGSYLVRELVKKFEVRCLVRDKNKAKALPTCVEIFYGDIIDKRACHLAVKNIDIVCHLAAQMRKGKIPEYWYWRVNVDGTKNILEASIKENIDQFIHCSTASIIGPIRGRTPLNEEYPYYDCSNIYKLTKAEAEKIVLRNKDKISITVISPEFIYGPGCFHYLPLFKAIRERKIFIVGSGNNLHQPTYVTDVVQGFLLVIGNKKAIGEKFIIAGKENITSKELILKIAKEMRINIKLFHLPVQPLKLLSQFLPIPPGAVDFFTTNHIYDISKAEKVLRYRPKVSIDEGIRKTVQWLNTLYENIKG